MKRLLALRLSALGDVIHAIPAVLSLRDALSDTQISWVVEASYAEMVEVVTGVSTIPVRMKRWGRSLISSRAEIAGALRAMRGAGTSVDFQGLVKSSTLGWLAGAATRYGFDRNAVREAAALLFTNRKVRVDTAKHVVDQNLELVAGLTANRHAPPADWSPFLEPVQGTEGSVVLLPGAGRPGKLWPGSRFRELASRIGDRALVVWGPGERELAAGIGARMAPPTSLRELAWILRHARAVVGADTGPLHLADALGAKVVGLYGPTDPRRNGPYTQPGGVISEFDRTKLMGAITVEQVMTMLGRVAAE